MKFLREVYSILGELLFCIILLVVIGAILFGAFSSMQCDLQSSYVQQKPIDLYSGYNDNTISGSGSIFGGSIDQVDVVYYWTNNDGVLKKHHVPMENSVFIEDGNNYMVAYERVCKYKLSFSTTLYKYEFHVPEGSVARMYEFK